MYNNIEENQTNSFTTEESWQWFMSNAKYFLYSYLVAELCFLTYYVVILLPQICRCKRKHRPRPIRDERFRKRPHELIRRLSKRFEGLEEAAPDGVCPCWNSKRSRFERLVESYFVQRPLQLYSRQRYDINGKEKEGVQISRSMRSAQSFRELYKKENMNDFLSWAFLSKYYEDLDDTEVEQVEECFHVIKEEVDFEAIPGRSKLVADRLNLDQPRLIPRPLIFYCCVYIFSLLSSLIYRYRGFRYFEGKNGLNYWYLEMNPNAKDVAQVSTLFFHGVAPGGALLYMPFFFHFLANSGGTKSAFIFELSSIAMKMNFDLFSEKEIVDSIVDTLSFHYCGGDRLRIVGHSFGTFVATWLNYSIPDRIDSLILMDPVSVMLSCSNLCQRFRFVHGWKDALRSVSRFITFIIASTEPGIQNYLRNNFYWYNSELFLDDIHHNTNVLLLLSMKDDLIDATTLKEEVDRINVSIQNNSKTRKKKLFTICKDYQHGNFLLDSDCWSEILNVVRNEF